MSLLRLMDELPPLESAHLAASAASGPPARPAFHFSYSVTHEGTTAFQLAASSAVVQWPYMFDFSFFAALGAVFQPAWGRAMPPLGRGLQPARAPWTYFNAVLRDSQVGVLVRAWVGTAAPGYHVAAGGCSQNSRSMGGSSPACTQ